MTPPWRYRLTPEPEVALEENTEGLWLKFCIIPLGEFEPVVRAINMEVCKPDETWLN